MARHVFVHIGDTHFHQNARQVDRLNALDQILDRAEALSDARVLAGIVWPGDLYHQRSTIEDRNQLIPRVQRAGRLAPVVIIPGNHDADGDLDVLAALQTIHPIVVEKLPTLRLVPTATDGSGVAMFLLPYPHKGGLVSAGIAHQAITQTAEGLLDAVMIDAADRLARAEACGQMPMFVTHINVGGAVSSVGQPQIGREIELSPALLDRLPAATAVLGNHIHKHQQVGRLVYAGSIARMDYGEQEPKGFLEWTWDDVAWSWSWAFQELATPEQIHVDGRLTRDGFQFDHDDWMCADCTDGDGPRGADGVLPCPACAGSGRRAWTGADIRVRYQFVKAEVNAIDVAHIHAEFAGCRSLQLDPVAILEHSVRAPEIAAAVTLEEKVRAYADRSGIVVTDGLIAKVTALQAHDGATVLQQVAAALGGASVVPSSPVDVFAEAAQ